MSESAETTPESGRIEDAFEALPEEIRKDLDLLPKESKNRVLMSMSSFFSGPLPPARELAAYNHAYDGCAQEIVEMAKLDQVHAHKINEMLVKANISTDRERSRIGAMLVTLFVVGSFLMIGLGQVAVGALTLVGTGGTLVGLYARSERDRQRALGSGDPPPRNMGAAKDEQPEILQHPS